MSFVVVCAVCFNDEPWQHQHKRVSLDCVARLSLDPLEPFQRDLEDQIDAWDAVDARAASLRVAWRATQRAKVAAEAVGTV